MYQTKKSTDSRRSTPTPRYETMLEKKEGLEGSIQGKKSEKSEIEERIEKKEEELDEVGERIDEKSLEVLEKVDSALGVQVKNL